MAKATTLTDSQSEQQKTKGAAVGSKQVRLAVSLLNGIKFTGIYSAPDGYVELPGVNSHIRDNSASSGILMDAGASILVAIPPEQWEEIQAKYGSAQVFTAVPPFIRVVKDADEYKNIQDELKEITTGAEPKTAEELDGKKKA